MLKKILIKTNKKKFYKLDNQQETLLQSKGSSETTRETTLNIDLLLWFIGFSEGDGSFIKSGNRFFFIISQNELIVLYKIKKLLKMGKVQKHGKYFRFILSKKIDIYSILDYFITYSVMQKTYIRLNNIFDKYIVFDKYNYNFLNNAWLSGFIDAEGCFYISLKKRKNYKFGYQIRIKLLLDQKFENNFNLFETLNKQIKGTLELRLVNNYRFIIENKKSITILINYLKRYPLKSHKKTIQYKNWLKCLCIKNKPIKTLNDLKKIKKIKSWRYSPPLYENIKN